MNQTIPELFSSAPFHTAVDRARIPSANRLNHLQTLEAESIYILREAVAEFSSPVMLYSIGKDSSVMLRLAQKAFFPGKIPFPLLHIDTSYKFPEMIEFRDSYAREIGAELIVHRNEEAIGRGANPFSLGTQKCCGLLKTKSLLDALAEGGFNAAFGGARRDEEKSRAKERIYSFRDSHGLYYAREREAVVRNGSLVLIHSKEELLPGEQPRLVKCRMRSLGCVPCTGAIRSEADTLPKIIEEMISFRRSERENRAIDHDEEGSMELKKREGYF